ncbi:response regulator [Nitriliruptor alkaliphilus]|uniref:response regulator n=1 Tax=Nitriliruptor alkaliphilus TaxID=427918 RepID=UPI000698D03A|nr:response regulator [Nitriliruptor alkaliphilus]
MAAPLRVLHVDDDEDIRFLVELTLDPAPDLVLSSYASGDAALEAALADPPDLALIDVMMPGLDGISLATAFRTSETLSEVPIVFVTAKAYPEEVARLRACGADEVLTKPFDLTALEEVIRGLLSTPEGRTPPGGSASSPGPAAGR